MSTIELVEAASPEDFEGARVLCRAFQRWLYGRYPDQRDVIEAYYPPAKFESLLADLPKIHAPPQGVILLAKRDGGIIGCGMMLALPELGACEMKRLFVDEAARGKGVARVLCGGLIDWSRKAGYQVMRLETGPLHHEALSLYPAMGFARRSAYYDAGPEWVDLSAYFERML